MSESTRPPHLNLIGATLAGEKDRAVAAGGGGPHDPGMEARLSALETAFVGMRETLARIDERTATLATKADVAELSGRVGALEHRATAQETATRDLGTKVDGKLIGGGQLFGILAGQLTLFFGFCAGAVAALRYFGLLHQ